MQQVNIAIFASGTGSNADKICQYFMHHPDIRIKLIISNRSEAGVLQIASFHEIESLVIPKSEWWDPNPILHVLREKEITHIVLAGYLLRLPPWLIEEFDGHIINIHPALLPKYGGKGMYGLNVHEKVKENNEEYSGITIHVVDENYDEGDIIFQEKIKLNPEDSATDVAKKVLKLEHFHYPRVIEKWVKNKE